MKSTLKAPGSNRLKLQYDAIAFKLCFQTLLSKSTCAATARFSFTFFGQLFDLHFRISLTLDSIIKAFETWMMVGG